MKRRRKLKVGRLLLLLSPLYLFLMVVFVLLNQRAIDQQSLIQEDGWITYTKEGYNQRYGIDVSEHNGQIDWDQVTLSRVDFAYIRIGYRSSVYGQIHLDKYFHQNIQGAQEAGLDVGLYWFSTATNEEELQEEIDFILKEIEDYDIDLSIAYDMEFYDHPQDRVLTLSQEEKTNLALTFCEQMEEEGYSTMIYGNLDWLYNQLDFEKISNQKLWYAAYLDEPKMEDKFTMWQFTNKGQIPGIEGNVDLNIWLLD